ncbi:MAG: VOC family protein [Lachnospirales bacterium]
MKLQVYLNFEGQAEEAAIFYNEALNGSELQVLKFGDLPANPDHPLPEQYKNYVMHTEVRSNDFVIQISDVIPGMTPVALTKGNNMSVTLIFNSDKEITETFNKLSEGGTVIMPLEKTMWAEKYAYFVDKFGTPWQLNFPGDKVYGK